MRILGIDHGERRIGLALSDPLGIIAGGLPTLAVTSEEQAVDEIRQLVRTREVEQIVVGLPRNMDGSIGPQAELAQAFAAKLEALGKPVHLVDERLTTERAQRTMKDAGFSHGKRRKHVDRMAAQFILQAWLDGRGRSDRKPASSDQ